MNAKKLPPSRKPTAPTVGEDPVIAASPCSPAAAMMGAQRVPPPKVAVRTVLQILVRGVRVDGGHEPALDSEHLVEHHRHRRQAVRST